ncbi:hypothetical protein NDU88_005986 [Pleurodeles waltl]|uniref:Uncharacterized protein n=1 Tax=Pleurodeles waltl TaxID=8319 RepID=A0AAV7ULI5_PLEWA|nr:hypothetical protein NDU88_005986 [Pleurodeles waltl]
MPRGQDHGTSQGEWRTGLLLAHRTCFGRRRQERAEATQAGMVRLGDPGGKKRQGHGRPAGSYHQRTAHRHFRPRVLLGGGVTVEDVRFPGAAFWHVKKL